MELALKSLCYAMFHKVILMNMIIMAMISSTHASSNIYIQHTTNLKI